MRGGFCVRGIWGRERVCDGCYGARFLHVSMSASHILLYNEAHSAISHGGSKLPPYSHTLGLSLILVRWLAPAVYCTL